MTISWNMFVTLLCHPMAMMLLTCADACRHMLTRRCRSTGMHKRNARSSLMMGCEQISENMPPVERLVQQLKGVKSTLSILEDSVNTPPPGTHVGTPQQYMPGSV